MESSFSVNPETGGEKAKQPKKGGQLNLQKGDGERGGEGLVVEREEKMVKGNEDPIKNTQAEKRLARKEARNKKMNENFVDENDDLDPIQLSNTLTSLLAVTERLLPSPNRSKLKSIAEDANQMGVSSKRVKPDESKTAVYDAIARLLTQKDEITAVLAFNAATVDIVASGDQPLGYFTSQNSLKNGDGSNSFSVVPKGNASAITDFSSLIAHMSTKNRIRHIPLKDHAATLAALLSPGIPTPSSSPSPSPGPAGFGKLKLHFFITAACFKKVMTRLHHRTMITILEYFKAKYKAFIPFLSSSNPGDISSLQDAGFHLRSQDDYQDAVKKLAAPSTEESDLALFQEVEKRLRNQTPTRDDIGIVARNPRFFYESSPLLYHVAFHAALITYTANIKLIGPALGLKRDGSMEEEFETVITHAALYGIALDTFVRSPLLSFHLGCFRDLPNIWNRSEETDSGDGSGVTQQGVESKTGGVSARGKGHDDEEGGEDDGNENRPANNGGHELDESEPELKWLTKDGQIVKVLQLLVSQVTATRTVSKYLKKRKHPQEINISVIAPPMVMEWKVIDVKRAIPLAYRRSKRVEDMPNVDHLCQRIETLVGELKDNDIGERIWHDLCMGTAANKGSYHCECILALLRLYPDAIISPDESISEDSLNHLRNAPLTIGVSKKCCPACAKFLELIHADLPSGSKPFNIVGFHRTWYQWAMSRLLSKKVQEGLLDFFSENLVERLRDLPDDKDDSDHSPDSTPTKSEFDDEDLDAMLGYEGRPGMGAPLDS